MSVTVPGLSGLTNAYVSVLSARGSPEINGASRWLDAFAVVGASAALVAASTAPVPARARSRRRRVGLEIVMEVPSAVIGVVGPMSPGRLPPTVCRPLERLLSGLSHRRRQPDRVRRKDGSPVSSANRTCQRHSGL